MKEDLYDVGISSVIAKKRGQYHDASFIVLCLLDYQLRLITFFGVEDHQYPPHCIGVNLSPQWPSLLLAIFFPRVILYNFF